MWERRLALAAIVLLGSACTSGGQAGSVTGKGGATDNATAPVAQGGVYRNLFREIGKTDAEIDTKVGAAVNAFFFGDETIRCYYTLGSDEAYILDSGNNDVRSEGMSYGMMIAVQAGLRPEFDRLWTFARRRLRHASGDRQGYFAWQANTDGSIRDHSSAPDGEQYLAMALFFAWKRWNDAAYKTAADDILHHMLHQDRYASPESGVTRMIDPTVKQIVFVPDGEGARFTDPSYHLPAFYELFARWASEDGAYWREVANASRAFFKAAAHPVTGLYPDYALFDGKPTDPWGSGHADFRADAWRVIQNVAVDRYWFGGDPWEAEAASRWQAFFASQGITTHGNMYTLAGQRLEPDHSAGLVAMNAVASLASTNARASEFVSHLWSIEPTRGRWRYYDGCLYLFGLLHCSGKYRMIGLEAAR
jgi:oligosaccharide reducing-end xylanase